MMMNLGLLLLSLAGAAETAPVMLRVQGIETLLIAPDRPATIRWRAEGPLPADPVRYRVEDFRDSEVCAGIAQRLDRQTIELTLTLAQGYYEVEFAGVAARFGVVAAPARSRPGDPFFAIDSAMSWLVRDPALREGLVGVLRRSGIAMARERLNWGEIQPTRDRFDWNGPRGYETLRQRYAAQGVSLLEMFHSATPWSGTVGKYPGDLVGTAAAWQSIARRWGTMWGGLEIWNEPDIFFGDHLPADQYAAVVKTLAYAVHAQAPDTPLVGGVVAHYHRPFLDTVAACGMLDCVDAASFHTYDQAARMQTLVSQYRDWLAAHQRADMPLWITESGRPWRRGRDRPPADQDIASALDITAKAIEARACGVTRYFAFVYPFYEENENNFGMMDRHGTPLRSFAAYAQAARVLSGKRYLGDLPLDGAQAPVRIFGDGRETVAVLTRSTTIAALRSVETPSPSAADRGEAAVPGDTAAPGGGERESGAAPASTAPGPADKRPVEAAESPRRLRAEALDGRRIELGDKGEIPVVDGLAYVWLDEATPMRLDTDTDAMRLWRLGQAASRRRAAPSPVVLRWQNDPASFHPETAGYRVVGEGSGPHRVVVRAFNLGEVPTDLRLRLDFEDSAARIEDPNPCRVHAAAGGFVDATWNVDLATAFAQADRVTATVRPIEDGTTGALPLTVALIGSPTLDQRLARHARRVRLPLGDSTRWRSNVSANGHLEIEPQPDESVVLTVRFDQGDRWVYPYFELPDELDPRRYTALVLRARCARPATVRIFLWEGTRGVGYLTVGGLIPADGQWHAAEAPFSELTLSPANAPDDNDRLDLDQVRRISFGMNSEADENRLEISDAYLVGPE